MLLARCILSIMSKIESHVLFLKYGYNSEMETLHARLLWTDVHLEYRLDDC